MLKAVIAEADNFCKDRKVNVAVIAAESRTFERAAMVAEAVERLIFPEEDKKEFLRKTGMVIRIHKAVMPDPVAHEFDGFRRVLEAIAANLCPSPEEVDISEIMKAVEELLDRSIAAKGYVIQPEKMVGRETQTKEQAYLGQLVDLSKIDFKTLKAHFDKGHSRTVIEKLKAVIEQRLQAMVKLNQSRLDYLRKFQQMIDEYNAGSMRILTECEHSFSSKMNTRSHGM